MPKPAVLHTHLTACATVDFLLNLTYNDFVYYSEKANKFKVNQRGVTDPDYMPVNVLRQYSQNADEFDRKLKDNILMKTDSKEDHAIWAIFQPKFDLTFELYNYAPFFRKVLTHACTNYIEECVTVVEYRQVFGCLFDEDGPLSIERELDIFHEVYAMLRTQYPLFRMKLISCGLKVLGRWHVEKMLEFYAETLLLEADKPFKLLSGFDLVCEEDYNGELDGYLDLLL